MATALICVDLAMTHGIPRLTPMEAVMGTWIRDDAPGC
ncbi:hypothetical protein ATK36_1941 [Amycolatopsis sulphurea]|uniref:Uncharacterized protein n=1 Tax=Amycolatopsis sulphurea TaxID=76022 RepID=A0A2A9F929_9PSEU|nr:hypothetical protein ATK36_1941 [Amycolatopsis sulphurea]